MTTWFTAVEAAEHAKVSLSIIRQAVQQGELPASAVGKSRRRYRLAADDVDAWMRSNSFEPGRAS